MLDLESTNCQVSHRRPRVSVFSQAMHFLFALTLVPVCSLRSVYGLSPSRAKPLPVAVLHLAVDDELEVASRHSTPFRTRSQDLSSPYPVSRRVKTCTKGALLPARAPQPPKPAPRSRRICRCRTSVLKVRKEGLYGTNSGPLSECTYLGATGEDAGGCPLWRPQRRRTVQRPPLQPG